MLAAPRARFAGASEYDRSYKWNESYKSGSYSPTGEQQMSSAGIESLRRHNVLEPPLQRRKRVDHTRESVQLGAPDTPTEDSFLLGGQKAEKFDPSKPHPNYSKEAHKRRSHSLAAQREQEQLEQEQRRREQQQQRRRRHASQSPPPPAPIDDGPTVATPDAPREVKRQLTMPSRQKMQQQSAAVANGRRGYDTDDNDVEDNAAVATAAAKISQHQQQRRRRRHQRDAAGRRRNRSQEAGSGGGGIGEASVSTKELEAQLAKARREARRLEAEAVMERERQREEGGGVGGAKAAAPEPYVRSKTPPYYHDADQYAVADPDYAKKKQLGLASGAGGRPLGNKPTKQTEYQTRYAPIEPSAQAAERRRQQLAKAAMESRAAAQRSHLDPPPQPTTTTATKSKVARSTPAAAVTEYRRQFQFKQPDTRLGTSLLPPRRQQKSAKLASASSQQQQPPPRVQVDGEEFRPQDALNPQRMSFPLGKYGVVSPLESEYRKSFSAGVGGANAAAAGTTSAVCDADWQRRLREARELRQRAAQYRLRSHGTHFSRQHLAQVYAPNGSLDAWQPLASARSEADADDRDDDIVGGGGDAEAAEALRRRPRTAPPPHPQAAWDSSDNNGGYESDVEAEDATDDVDDVVVRRRGRGRQAAAAGGGSELRRRQRARSAGSSGGGPAATSQLQQRRRLPEDDTAGRYGTPRIRDSGRRGGSGYYARHHYDRTTPNYGGILVGRSDAATAGSATAADVDDAGVDFDAEVEAMGRPLGGRKPVGRLIKESRQLLNGGSGGGDRRRRHSTELSPSSRPPAGLPTRDVAPLVDETASHDTPLQSPRQQQQPQQQQNRQIQRRRQEPRVNAPPSYAAEPAAPAAAASAPLDDGQFSDGFFSDTASLVSSTTMSLGSQTLERARARQETFWGRK